MPSATRRAVFLDRDGIINELVYYPEHGIVDSPSNPEQFRLVEGIDRPLNRLKEMGYELILVSNQPGVAKGNFDMRTFKAIKKKMNNDLQRFKVRLDGEYYCLHHPAARIPQYRLRCDCRKPEPGLILTGAKDHRISLKESFVIGDGLVDVKAGNSAGCVTLLVCNINSLLIRLMKEIGAQPDYVTRDVSKAVDIIASLPQRVTHPA